MRDHEELYRISALLDATREFRDRPQRRYDDTALLMAEMAGYEAARFRFSDTNRRVAGTRSRPSAAARSACGRHCPVPDAGRA